MKVCCLSLLLGVASFSQVSPCRAIPVSGFEDGLGAWSHIGDVSVQTNLIGQPSEGSHQALLTTLCDSRFVSWCEVTNPESPYSGTSSVPALSAAGFLGLPSDPGDFAALLPIVPENGVVGETGAMKTRFYGNAGDVLSFDWKHYAQDGTEGDSSYFTVWDDEPFADFRFIDYLRYGFASPAHVPSRINLCERVIGNNCEGSFTYDTGYLTRSLILPSDGWYWIGFGMFESEEGTVPSALAIDNIRLITEVPTPPVGGLVGLALVAFLFFRNRSRGQLAADRRSGCSVARSGHSALEDTRQRGGEIAARVSQHRRQFRCEC